MKGPGDRVGRVPLVAAVHDYLHGVTDEIDATGVELDRLFTRGIVVATLVGAAVRIAVLVSKWNQQLLLNDSLYYFAQAKNNANGQWFKDFFGVAEGAEHAPLTSLVLTPVGLIDDALPWMRLTMTAIGICLVPLVGILALRIGGRRAGVVAAMLAALYPNLWMSDSLVMSETIANVLIAGALLAAVGHRQRFTWRSAAMVGVLIGLAGLARAEVLIFAPLLALIGWRREPVRLWASRAAVVVLATLIVIAPWTTYNLGRFDEPVLMSTNEGQTLVGANCPQSYFGAGIGGWSVLCVDDPLAAGDEDASQRSIRQRSEALAYANSHRSRLVLVAAARLGRLVDAYGLTDLVAADTGEERDEWAVWAGVVGWWLLAPMAVVGWWRSRRQFGLILGTPAIAVLTTAIVFYGAHRLRSPVESAIVVAAALFIVRIGPVQSAIESAIDRRSKR